MRGPGRSFYYRNKLVAADILYNLPVTGSLSPLCPSSQGTAHKDVLDQAWSSWLYFGASLLCLRVAIKIVQPSLIDTGARYLSKIPELDTVARYQSRMP